MIMTHVLNGFVQFTYIRRRVRREGERPAAVGGPEPFFLLITMKRYLLLTIVLVAAVVVSAVFIYRGFTRDASPVPPSASSQTPSLEDAIVLLPNSALAVSGDEIAPGFFWAWTEEIRSSQEGDIHHVTSWLINTESGEATVLDERDYGFPGVSISHERSDERYYHLGWNAGWEQGTYDRNEYLDRSTGRIAYVFETSSNNALEIAHGDEVLRIRFEPSDGCEVFADEATVNGIRVNDRLIVVDPPQTVACVTNDMTGEATYAFGFETAGLSDEGEVIRVELPWNQVLEIPADAVDEGEAQLVTN